MEREKEAERALKKIGKLESKKERKKERREKMRLELARMLKYWEEQRERVQDVKIKGKWNSKEDIKK